MESDRMKNILGDTISLDMLETPDGGLMQEKQLFNTTMQQLSTIITYNDPINCKQKNKLDSIEYNEQGNSLYSSNLHNADIHQQILNLYTQSIATAPIVSKELAYAYGTRSALLFHLKKYDECIKDCNEGLQITNADDLLKAELYIRKIESSLALDMGITKNICEEVLVELSQLNLTAYQQNIFTKTVNNILNSISTVNFKNKTEEPKNHQVPLFPKQTEAPCASTAISIKYNDFEGRHIIANRKIEPGEILVVEKNYCQCVDFDYKYLFCSHCMQPTWASIPCQECIYSIYCSEKCKSEAWEKYHRYECSVLSYLYSIELDKHPYLPSRETKNGKLILRTITLALRLLLLSVHEFGDTTKLEKELIYFAHELGVDKFSDALDMRKALAQIKEEIPNHTDTQKSFRTRGFSANGIFDSKTYKSIFSLRNSKHNINIVDMKQIVTIVCIATYYLAKESTFFGKKISETPTEMTQNKNIKFFGALLLKNVCIITTNAIHVKHFKIKDGVTVSFNHGVSLSPFCSLFNHSCNPNVISFTTKNNETLIYAKHPIEKGQQLFLCYIDDDFTSLPKSRRIQVLNDLYYFECKCLACEDGWPTCLPSIKDFLDNTLEQGSLLAYKYEKIKNLENQMTSNLQAKKICYPTVMKNLSQLLQEYAENFTVHSKEYEMFANYMKDKLVDTYGIVQEIEETC